MSLTEAIYAEDALDRDPEFFDWDDADEEEALWLAVPAAAVQERLGAATTCGAEAEELI
jgi:hypothetical protein